MKTILIAAYILAGNLLAFTFMSCNTTRSGCPRNQHMVGYGLNTRNKIDSVFAPDELGRQSVWFTQDGKKWGLDALTPFELDSLKNSLK